MSIKEIKEKAREKVHNYLNTRCEKHPDFFPTECDCVYEISDQIIDFTLKEIEEELINGIEKIKESVRETNGTFKYDNCYDDVINLIKYKNENTKN